MFDFLETLKISRRKSDSELRTLQFWMMDGAALCLLAGAGMFVTHLLRHSN